VDRFEYRCPKHGVVWFYRCSNPHPSRPPETCPRRNGEECGEPLGFQIRAWSGPDDDEPEPEPTAV
jgi:hypothetical protein